jgi:hypothetical protein
MQQPTILALQQQLPFHQHHSSGGPDSSARKPLIRAAAAAVFPVLVLVRSINALATAVMLSSVPVLERDICTLALVRLCAPSGSGSLAPTNANFIHRQQQQLIKLWRQ